MTVKHPKTFLSGGFRWRIVFSSPSKDSVFDARKMYKGKYTRIAKLSNGWWAIGVRPIFKR